PESLGSFRVRIALHSGPIQADGNDYRGPVVNRVARLEGIAHGGQVVLSEATRALVQDSLPAGTSLRDLGSHMLRGMDRAEQVYQLCVPDLMNDFPPLRTETGGGVPLPSYQTSFVGREEERSTIGELLSSDDTRLVTLLGPGGIGKTRLAVETARDLVEDFGGGAMFVDLVRTSDPADVGLVIAEAVGAHPEGMASPVALAAARILDPTLLVLDNFEHVQEASTTVADLLDASADVRMIATSRAPLNIRGERIYRVEPLGSVNGDGRVPPALALFYERVASHGVNLSTEGGEAEAAKMIVRRLDGLPLAIELVAARTRLMGVRELEQMLTESLDVLGSGAADLPERQRTIRSTIEWSLDSVTDAQRRLFAQISVFPAGPTLAQLRAVAASDSDLLDDLTVLVDNSLVSPATGLAGGTRYRQLVLLRDYGAELLAKFGDLDVTLGRLVDYYTSVSPEIGRRLQEMEEPHRELRVDHANLLAAMWWALEHDRLADMVDVVSDLWVYWFNGDLAANGSEWVARADPMLDSAKLDWLVGFFALQEGDAEAAVKRLAGALERFSKAADELWIARSELFLSFFIEDSKEGGSLASSAVETFEGLGNQVDFFMARLMFSSFRLREGDIDQAVAVRQEIVEWAIAQDYGVLIAWAEWNYAIVLLFAGRIDEASDANQRSLVRMVADGYQEGVASSADLVAVVRIHRGDVEGGLRVLGGAISIWDNLGSARWPEATILVEQALEAARSALGDSDVERHIQEGSKLTLSQLIETAKEDSI
ncbi:MAG: hypothetical protein KJO36_02840, partial [Acidimicrobiia bacterium]|nr:hypothetical protein [Acidimicrobiia bacterium]